MIQIYRPGNESFADNGDVVLFCRSCEVEAQLNGTWHLELDVPIDKDGRWKQVVVGAVLKVPTWQTTGQLYRIAKMTKTEEGVTATAYPIFFDSANDTFLMDVRPANKSAQQALDLMTADSPYSGQSNISKHATTYFVRRNLMSALNGSESPTFIEKWGGEILYDNYTVIVNDRVGGDYGMEARYGKNIVGVRYEVDTSELITRIVPVAYNGYMMSGAEPWVDSEHIDSFPKVYTKEVHYEYIRMAADATGDTDGMVICDDQADLDAALQDAAEADFAAGVDAPRVSIDIDMAMVRSKMAEFAEPLLDSSGQPITDEDDKDVLAVWYRDFSDLEQVRLGDTVKCRHYKLDITSTARVVSLTWDCVRKRVSRVILGDQKFDYVRNISQAVSRVNRVLSNDGTIAAERVKGFLDGAQAQLRTQYNLAQRQDVMAILFENLDPNSPMYGALGIGTQGICISKTPSIEGRDWQWTTGITANGINAEMGIFGLLSDKTGTNYIDMDTGDAHIGSQQSYIDYNATAGTLSIIASSVHIGARDIGTELTDAAKTATSFLHVTNAGLVINNNESSTDYGKSVRISGETIQFRDGTTIRASISGSEFRINRYVTDSEGWEHNYKALVISDTAITLYKPDESVGVRITADGIIIQSGEIASMKIESDRLKFTRAADQAQQIYRSVASFGSHSSRAVSVWLGDSYTDPSSGEYKFYVNYDGKLFAKDADVRGSITARSGELGGWSINSNGLYNGNTHLYPGGLITESFQLYKSSYSGGIISMRSTTDPVFAPYNFINYGTMFLDKGFSVGLSNFTLGSQITVPYLLGLDDSGNLIIVSVNNLPTESQMMVPYLLGIDSNGKFVKVN